MDIFWMIFALGYFSFITAYYGFQIIRNNKIHKIRKEWLESGDSRVFTYDYYNMVAPRKNNYFGFRIPQDSDYPNVPNFTNINFVKEWLSVYTDTPIDKFTDAENKIAEIILYYYIDVLSIMIDARGGEYGKGSKI